jgi:hypothetical protein
MSATRKFEEVVDVARVGDAGNQTRLAFKPVERVSWRDV